jgi:NADPH-dependent curcumin reductase CurA
MPEIALRRKAFLLQQSITARGSEGATVGQLGKLKGCRVDGLENAPQAFIGLLNGKNFGKLVIRVNWQG